MKNTKLLKVLIPVLSLALVICAAIGFSVSADTEEPSNKIVSMNISHGDTIQVLVAVDASLDNPDSVTVKYVDAYGEEKTARYYKNMEIWGTSYPVWYTDGIPAKDLGQDVVATVYVDGTPVDSANVSVAGYLYSKLYKENYINATETKDVNRKNLYLNLLEYAASAEQSLWNDREENADNQRVLITDKFYVYAEGATLSKNVYTVDDEVTLTYAGTAPEGYTFTGKWISTIDGLSIVCDGDKFNPVAHAVYTPVYESATVSAGGKYYTSETVGTRYAFTDELNLSDISEDNPGDLSVYNAETNPTGLLGGELFANDGKQAFLVDKNMTLDNSSGSLVFNMTEADWGEFTIANTGNTVGKTGSTYVFEADFTYNGGTAYTGNGSNPDKQPLTFGFTSNNGQLSSINGLNQLYYAADYQALTLYGEPLVQDVTYNIRIKYTVGGEYQVFVNDKCVYSATKLALATGSTADANVLTGVAFAIRQRHAGDSFSFTLDNVYIGNLDSYYADKTIEGTRYDFDKVLDLSYSADGNTALSVWSEENPNGILASDFDIDAAGTFAKAEYATLSNTDGRLVYTMNATKYGGFTLANKGDRTGVAGSKYICEFDFTYVSHPGTANAVDGVPFGIGLTKGTSDMTNDMFVLRQPTYQDDDYATINWFNKATLEKGKTYKVRIEHTVDVDTKIYIDNVLVETYTGTNRSIADESFVGFAIYFRGKHTATNCTADAPFSISLDNVFMTVIDPQ